MVKLSEKRCLNCGHSLPLNAKFCNNCGSYSLETVSPYYPPPPPPPPPEFLPHGTRKGRSTKKIVLGVATALIIVTLIIATIFVFPEIFPSSQQNVNSDGEVSITTGSTNKAAEITISTEGGTISITDTSSPIYGLKIEFPESATKENVNIAISYADVTEIRGLPENTSIASKLITIETSGSPEWDKTKHFNSPVLVTLPYDPNADSSEQLVRFYCYDRQHQTLDSAGFTYEDPAAHTVSFYTASFSDFIGIDSWLYFKYGFEELNDEWNPWATPPNVDTGFRPANNGWYMKNRGTYINIIGNCLGMVAYAKWFYRYKSVANWIEADGVGAWVSTGIKLFEKYKEGDIDEWRDDATALQLATRAQIAAQEVVNKIKDEYYAANLTIRANSRKVALTWLHGMIVTHEPQPIILETQFSNGQKSGPGHAVLAYRYANGRFDIYDPNNPATPPNTDARQIPFNYSVGFSRPYSSSINPDERAVQFNFFIALGWKVFASQDFYEGLYEAAENKFEDDDIFPKVSFTSESTTPVGTTPEDTDGDGLRDTDQQKIIISGTMVGGQPGSIGDGVIFVSGQQFPVLLMGQYPDYSFSIEVPLFQGDNEVFFVSSVDLFRYWAGFLKDTIRCNATETFMAVTLTWRQDDSDIDLHVLEPTIGETEGRHIYYSNKGGYAGGKYPYLDIDNRVGGGLGPEHYYAAENMTLPNYEGSGTSLYGVYKIRVQYYRDKDADENRTQTINWELTVKILAFKIEQTGQEFWIDKSMSGTLSTENAYGTSDFYSSDGSWSAILEIEYPEPNPGDYNVPPPPQNNLPK